jgi:hypothetical protein
LVHPDFLIIGAQKSGTTSLAGALRKHPDIFIPLVKEAHHFGVVPDDEVGGPAYAEFFRGWEGEQLVGEATPEYLYLPRAPRQIYGHLPDVRCIAVLRNPVDRAYSAYWHAVRWGLVRGPFEEALAMEPRRLGLGEYGFFSFVDRGRYVVQLRRYERHGFDSTQLHIVVFEDLTSRTTAILSEVQTFLGVADAPVELPLNNPARRSILPPSIRSVVATRRRVPLVRRNMRRLERLFHPPPMAPMTRKRLTDYFRPYNDALADWLGRDLSVWEGP